jgi:secreted trypsin-like serine protease
VIRTLLVLVALLVGAAPAVAGPEIVGGQFDTDAHPWIVALQTKQNQLRGAHYCAGELITAQWVLTAAHCAEESTVNDTARIGSNNRSVDGTVVGIGRAVPHPAYDESTGHNDIALIQLTRLVPQTPAVLASGSDWDGITLRLLGWGQTCPTRGCDRGSNLLRRVDNAVLSPTQCRSEGLNFDPASELCMDSRDNRTACFGDSGGPALRNGQVVGIISRGGRSCGAADTVVARVQVYADWIRQTIS